MYPRPLFSITYDGFYSTGVSIRLRFFNRNRGGNERQTVLPGAWLPDDRASPATAGRPVGKRRRPFEAHGEQAAALHMAFGAPRLVLIQLSKSDSSILVKRVGHSYIVVRLAGCKSRCKRLLVWTFSDDPKRSTIARRTRRF